MIFKDVRSEPMLDVEFREDLRLVLLGSVNGLLDVIISPISLNLSWEDVYQAGYLMYYCATGDGSYVKFAKSGLARWEVIESEGETIGYLYSKDMETLFKTYLSKLYLNSHSLEPEKDLASRIEELEDEIYFLNEGKRKKAKRKENLDLLVSTWFLMLVPTFAMFLVSDTVGNLSIRLVLMMIITTLSGFGVYKLGVFDGVEKCKETEED